MRRWIVLLAVLGLLFSALYYVGQFPVEGQTNTSLTAGLGTPVLDGIASPGEWTGDSVTTPRGITISAMIDEENVYVLASWPDETPSVSKDEWVWDGEKWVASGEDEDRIAFVWEIRDQLGNPLNGEEGASCAAMCHPPAHRTAVGNVDVWHLKATRGLPIGYSDDQFWDPQGRKSDDGVSAETRNRNAEQTGPVYGPVGATFLVDSEAALAAFSASGAHLGTAAVRVLLEGEEVFEEGDTIPGRILRLPQGNRASVRAIGRWDDGVWTVEFSRNRDADVGADGQLQDFAVVPGGSVNFSVDIFDNSGGAAHFFTPAGNSNFGDGTVYTLHFPDPQAYYFAQFGGGGGLTSDLVLTNPSADAAVEATIDLYDADGAPLQIGLEVTADGGYPYHFGIGPANAHSSLEVLVPPLGSVVVSTDPAGQLAVGAAAVRSDYPLGGVVRFSVPGIGITGVGASEALSGFISPVRRTAGVVSTGVAIHNVGNEPVVIDLSLRTTAEGEVATATIEDFPGRGYVASFIEEIFEGVDTSAFSGTIVVTVREGLIAATVIEQGPAAGQFTTLPVTPLR